MAGSGNTEEDYGMLASLAERLGLDEKQSEGFISESMQRLGYKPKTSWEAAQEDGDEGSSGSFFGGNSGGRRGNQRGGNQRGGNSGGGGGGWQYDS